MGINFFSKTRKITRLSNTEASINQDKRSQTNFQTKTGQDTEKPTAV